MNPFNLKSLQPVRLGISLAASILISQPLFVSAQKSSGNDWKYVISANGGAITTLAKRGPQGPTAIGEVRFLHPVMKSVNASFDIRYREDYFLGVLLGFDQFDLGYEAVSAPKAGGGVSLQSGLHGAVDEIGVYKAGIRAGRRFELSRKFSLETVLIASVGFLPHSSYLEDTSQNYGMRTPRRSVWYIPKPSDQDNSIKFLPGLQLGLNYRLSRSIDMGLLINFQKGFSTIVRDTTTIIRMDVPGGPVQQDYWTHVDGTAFGGQLQLRYRF